jgi:hypothetical protein
LAWFFLPDTRISSKSASGYNTVQGRTKKYPKVLMVCAGTCWYIPVYTSWYIPAYTGIYWYIPACPVLSDTRITSNPQVDTTLYKAGQGRTMKYLMVCAGTCWYIPAYTD